MKIQKTAIILGATGLTGGIVLKRVLSDSSYTKIKLFSRKPSGIVNHKIDEYIVDLLHLEDSKLYFHADEVFCCIGTTAKKTKSKVLYKAIDYGIVTTAAKLSKENKIDTFIVVSAMGANAKSSVFYNKTKGEMEESVLNQDIKNTYILRPSLIIGNRKEQRLGENIGVSISKIINPLLIGKLKKYSAISANKIADAMLIIAKNKPTKTIFLSDQIQQITLK